MKVTITRFDYCVYIIWTLFFGVFLLSYDYTGAWISVILTFYLIGLFSFWMCIRPQRNVSIRRNIYIFYLIFYFFAPMQQYLSGTKLWEKNDMSYVYTDEDYLWANICILLSIICFEVGYFLYENHLKKTVQQLVKRQKKQVEQKLPAPQRERRTESASMEILMAITLAAAAILIVTKGTTRILSESAIILQIKHMILFTPVICLIISMVNVKEKTIKNNLCMLAIGAITMFLFVFYSGTMARFIMHGAFMAIVSYMIVDWKDKSIYFSIYIVGFFFAFSMMRYTSLLSGDILHFVDFRQYDYDAYQIFMLTVHYVRNHGISWGLNLASALFCLVPRSLASWRLESTGGIVMEYAGSWFKNVSCPAQAEMYFAFGVAGIIVLSFLLGLLVSLIDAKYEKPKHFAKGIFAFLSGLTLYIMRGSLLAAFSYTVGILIAYWAIYRVVYYKVRIK